MHRILFILIPTFFLLSCENHNFDGDKRQIVAKDVVRWTFVPPKSRNFDIVRFKEDTLSSWTDSTFKRPLRYTIDFVYTDSTGAVQNKTGVVLFAPDGRSMITAQLSNPNQ
jgi:hypothetical protein